MRQFLGVSRGTIYGYRTKRGRRWRWQAVATYAVEAGKTERVTVGEGGFPTQKLAAESLDLCRQKLKDQGTTGTELPEAPQTFREVGERWLDSLDLANSTLVGYRKNLNNHVFPHLGDSNVAHLEPQDLNDLYKRLASSGRKDDKDQGGKLRASTLLKIHHNISQILEYARRHSVVKENIAKSYLIEKPTPRQVLNEADEVEIWSASQLKKVMDWNEKVDRDSLNVLWRLIASTGMRRGEAVALKWKDIDFHRGQLSIRRAADSATARGLKPTKTYRHRHIGLNRSMLQKLEQYREERSNLGPSFVAAGAFVFGTDENLLRGPNDVTRRWSKMVRRARSSLGEANIPWVTLKGLRHSHATHLFQASVQPKAVQERLGHTNIQTTLDIYSHVTPTIQADAVRAVEQIWEATE